MLKLQTNRTRFLPEPKEPTGRAREGARGSAGEGRERTFPEWQRQSGGWTFQKTNFEFNKICNFLMTHDPRPAGTEAGDQQ